MNSPALASSPLTRTGQQRSNRLRGGNRADAASAAHFRHAQLSPVACSRIPGHYQALSALVSELVTVRAQMQRLQADEAALLSRAEALACQIANDESHSDHGEFAHRAVAAELGTAVHESDRAMAAKIDRSVTLVRHYPEVLECLRTGVVSLAHTTVITDAGRVIQGEDARAEFARGALEIARREVCGRARPIIKELAERFAERTLDERHSEARACRSVRILDREDGMADLIATLPASYAYGVKDRLDQMAREVKSAETPAGKTQPPSAGAGSAGTGTAEPDPAESYSASPTNPRSMDQIRADLLTDLLLASNPNAVATGGATGLGSIRARVHVIVPEARILPEDGVDPRSDPSHEFCEATLEGFGPIDTDTAQLLAGHAPRWERIAVSNDEGTVLSVDTYRPSAAQRQFLGARDLHCRFPGCRVSIRRCDIDHTIDAARGGPTSTDNLAHLCRWHHTLKHQSSWKVRQEADGVLIWTSPTGRSHTEPPPSRVRFHQPPGHVGPSEGPDRAT